MQPNSLNVPTLEADEILRHDTKQKKLTKRELLELADYMYSRYEASKKPLNNGLVPPIIKPVINDIKTKKGGAP